MCRWCSFQISDLQDACRTASRLMCPVVANTSGVKLPFSTSLILFPYSISFACSWHLYRFGILEWRLLCVFGWKTLTSKTAHCWHPRSLLHRCLLWHHHVCLQKGAWCSRQWEVVMVVLFQHFYTPHWASLQWCLVYHCVSLWSVENIAPQTQWLSKFLNCHPYQRHKHPGTLACWEWTLAFAINGRAVNHVDAPF